MHGLLRDGQATQRMWRQNQPAHTCMACAGHVLGWTIVDPDHGSPGSTAGGGGASLVHPSVPHGRSRAAPCSTISLVPPPLAHMSDGVAVQLLEAQCTVCVTQPPAPRVQVDPTLSRTVVVSTKFDTRIPQFATAADADAFLHPSSSQLGGAQMLGGSPFFTSVPSGRVGGTKDSVFRGCAPFPTFSDPHALPPMFTCLCVWSRAEQVRMLLLRLARPASPAHRQAVVHY